MGTGKTRDFLWCFYSGGIVVYRLCRPCGATFLLYVRVQGGEDEGSLIFDYHMSPCQLSLLTCEFITSQVHTNIEFGNVDSGTMVRVFASVGGALLFQ